MRRVAGEWLRRWPLAGPVVVGTLLRTVAALAGYGFFASDDYTHVIGMAYTWLEGPAPFNSDLRSPLLARIVWLCFEAASACGISDPATLLHATYVVLGLASVAAIPGVYALTERRFGVRAASTAAWLMAADALMPRIATRALISVVAMVPLVWGTVFVDKQRGFLGGLLLGVATLFRYQVGLVCVTIAVLLAMSRQWRTLAFALLGGALAALAQGLIDLQTQGAWFASIINYVRFNETGASRYGVAPWFTYVLDFIGLTIPPATAWLVKPLWRTARAVALVSLPFAVFVIAHSLVPHKEEHFIFAVLPYFFVLLGVALASVRRSVQAWFWGVNTLALALVTVSDGHRALTAPLLEAGRAGTFDRVYFVGRLLTPDFYLGHHVELRRVEAASELIPALAGETALRTRIIFENAPDDDTVRGLDTSGFGCGAPELYRGDVIDRILVLVNPVNRRRGEKVVVDCLR